MTISKTRNYDNANDFCIYIGYDGEFVYQDIFGYKSYKTIAGLERMLRKRGYLADGERVTVA